MSPSILCHHWCLTLWFWYILYTKVARVKSQPSQSTAVFAWRDGVFNYHFIKQFIQIFRYVLRVLTQDGFLIIPVCLMLSSAFLVQSTVKWSAAWSRPSGSGGESRRAPVAAAAGATGKTEGEAGGEGSSYWSGWIITTSLGPKPIDDGWYREIIPKWGFIQVNELLLFTQMDCKWL